MNSDSLVKILFVCFGNTCRSPMAEAIFRNLLKQQNLEDRFEVDSAGISEKVIKQLWWLISNEINRLGGWQAGQEPNDFVKVIMERHGIPIDHRARQITLQDISSFSYLIGMDHYNINELSRYVSAAGRDTEVLLLGDFNPDSRDRIISDPYFDNRQEDFEKCYLQIINSCKELLKHLVNKLENKNQELWFGVCTDRDWFEFVK